MNNLTNKKFIKQFVNTGLVLKSKEIPPSMLIDYNLNLLKIWKLLRKNNYTFHSPKPEMLNINFKGTISLNDFDNIIKVTKSSSAVSNYVKYFLIGCY